MPNRFYTSDLYRRLGRADHHGRDRTALPRFCPKVRSEFPRDGLAGLQVALGLTTKNPNSRWYKITGPMPAGLYFVVLCYATVVILLGSAPWNVLLLLLLFPDRNKWLRFRTLHPSNGSAL